jgi:hypothetical protein
MHDFYDRFLNHRALVILSVSPFLYTRSWEWGGEVGAFMRWCGAGVAWELRTARLAAEMLISVSIIM